MIKNEEKILRRLLDSALFCLDAILISDTGSTDGTVALAQIISKEISIPVQVEQSIFVNFGVSRSLSFTQAQKFCAKLGWDPTKTWGLLLDGDMLLKKGDKFDKNFLKESGYMLSQGTASFETYNTRLVRLSDNWVTIGVTHEYWSGPASPVRLSHEFLWINDIGDGGCKSDKFERDVRLLEQGIKDNPATARYYFYLAQSYKDLRNFTKAIELYEKRISLGGWYEEVWYCYYAIAMCYDRMNKPFDCELWANRAFEILPRRAEPIYLVTKLFRCRGDHFKAFHYCRIGLKIPYPKDELLFVEKSVYSGLFEYEQTIIHYYISPDRPAGAKLSMKYLNRQNTDYWDNVFSNGAFYAPRLCDTLGGIHKKLTVDCPDTDFKASSVSLIAVDGRILANMRFVNYVIDTRGSYIMRENGALSPHNNVRTKNGAVYLDSDFAPASPVKMIADDKGLKSRKTNILGAEDVRLFAQDGQIWYTATTREYAPDDKNRIVVGIYDPVAGECIKSELVAPPTDTSCEKNWIGVGSATGANIIYSWHPLQIGRIIDKKLKIALTHETPYYFHNQRGSSSLAEIKGELWGVTHAYIHHEGSAREYLHTIVVLDKKTFRLSRYSRPFSFTGSRIEYCLGCVALPQSDALGDRLVLAYSANDANPGIISIPLERAEELMKWND